MSVVLDAVAVPTAAVDESFRPDDDMIVQGVSSAGLLVGHELFIELLSRLGSAELDRNIRRTWTQPVYIGREILSAMVSLTLSSSGRVLRLDLVKPSGYDPLDRSVIRAVREASPFPPFPHFLGRDDLTVQIVFDLNPKGFEASPSGD